MLVDDLFKNRREIHNKYWVMRPSVGIWRRIRSAFFVLIGREIGVEFAEDKFKRDRKWSRNNISLLSEAAVEQCKEAGDVEMLKEVYGDKVKIGKDGSFGFHVGRNELCPCGSKKKFKHCHGKDEYQ